VKGSTQCNAPAEPQLPGAGNEIGGLDATSTLLTPEALAYAARVRDAEREAVKNKSYRATPVGGEAGRFLRSLRWADKSQNTLDTYEIVLARLAVDTAHLELADLTTELIRDFLDDHWGEAAPATRRNRLSIVNSFLSWAVDEGRLEQNPAARIKPPKRHSVERNAYQPDLIETLIRAQPMLRDQIGLQMLGRLALRKNELRLLQLGDFDLAHGTVRVHGKGGKIVMLPLGYQSLKSDLELHLLDRQPGEYLIYPKNHRTRPMDHASIHRWFKICLDRAGLPGSIKMHEMRHSAADNLWRQTGNLMLAQQLLRHESVATTQVYLHPNRDDLAAALAAMERSGSDVR
jgi:site-specific recombinase XerC